MLDYKKICELMPSMKKRTDWIVLILGLGHKDDVSGMSMMQVRQKMKEMNFPKEIVSRVSGLVHQALYEPEPRIIRENQWNSHSRNNQYRLNNFGYVYFCERILILLEQRLPAQEVKNG